MAHLTDMEELIASVAQPEIADYMREALACYSSGAYRGCVVLSCIALFDDLLAKVESIKGVNSDAAFVFTEATRKRSDQEVFETFLLDQLASKNLIPSLTSVLLGQIKTLRNKSAHPSGHKPTAEEARYVFSEVVRMVLSQKTLMTNQLVEYILSRMANANFFPNPTFQEICKVVISEVEHLHPSSYAYLVSKLVDRLADANADISKNSKFFLLGIAQKDTPEGNEAIAKKFLTVRADDATQAMNITATLSANPKLLELLDPVTLARIKALITRLILQTPSYLSTSSLEHPFFMLGAASRIIEGTRLVQLLGSEFDTAIQKDPLDPTLAIAVSHDATLTRKLIAQLIAAARSTTFDVANAFVVQYQQVEPLLTRLLPGIDAFRVSLAILKAAQHGAWRSQAIVNNHYQSVPLTRDKAIRFIAEQAENASSVLSEFSGISLEEIQAALSLPPAPPPPPPVTPPTT